MLRMTKNGGLKIKPFSQPNGCQLPLAGTPQVLTHAENYNRVSPMPRGDVDERRQRGFEKRFFAELRMTNYFDKKKTTIYSGFCF